MQNDNDLRDRFQRLATEDASAAPPFTKPARVIRVTRWYAPRRLAFAGASLAAATLMLAVGLIWGTSTGYASARVQGERERSAIAANALGVTRQLASLRRELARTRAGLAQLAAVQGSAAHTSLLAAEAEVDSMTANVGRIERNVSLTTNPTSPEGPVFAILRTMPVRTALAALTCNPAVPAPHVAPLQKGIPVIELPPASTRAAATFGAVLGIKQVSDGKVLVNDARRRQLKLFDSTLTTSSVVRDSLPGSATSYGRLGTPLIPYLGDSSLIADWSTAQNMLLLDGHGQVVRAVDLPGVGIYGNVNSGYTGVDNKGRLIIRGRRDPRGHTGDMSYPDSVPIIRADFDLRRVDTISFIRRPVMRITTEKSSDGHQTQLFALDPLQSVDEFAVLSNGSVALVRGHDYHIDWVPPDGAPFATPKLPFDWKRRGDDDKTRLADSVRGAQNALLATGYGQAEVAFTTGPCDQQGPPPGATGRSGGTGEPGPRTNCTRFENNIVAAALGVQRSPRPPLAELTRVGAIDDYDAPIRPGSTVADLDGNLWVLPRTTTLSKKGELVYDVINAKGEIFERVRLPLGRAIAGFARGGVVYLTSGDMANGFTLERTRLTPSTNASPK